jgi:plasmid stability protein
MAAQITIRDVPDDVRRELASRASREGRSMQEYLRAQLIRIAARPSVDRWLEQVRARKLSAQRRLRASVIVGHRNADRR